MNLCRYRCWLHFRWRKNRRVPRVPGTTLHVPKPRRHKPRHLEGIRWRWWKNALTYLDVKDTRYH